MYPSRMRLAAASLVLAGVLFLLYPAVRPWDDETTPSGAVQAMNSGAWVASHLFAILGFILVPFGLLALRHAVRHTRAESIAFAATVAGWLGVGLTLPYYGAEDFGLHAIASHAADGQVTDMLGLVDELRFGAVAAVTFGVGLLSIGAAAVLAAVAVARSGVLPRYGGVPFALGFALFIPQFAMPAPVRIGHGALVAAGSILLAVLLWRSGTRVAQPVDA